MNSVISVLQVMWSIITWPFSPWESAKISKDNGRLQFYSDSVAISGEGTADVLISATYMFAVIVSCTNFEEEEWTHLRLTSQRLAKGFYIGVEGLPARSALTLEVQEQDSLFKEVFFQVWESVDSNDGIEVTYLLRPRQAVPIKIGFSAIACTAIGMAIKKLFF